MPMPISLCRLRGTILKWMPTCPQVYLPPGRMLVTCNSFTACNALDFSQVKTVPEMLAAALALA